MGPGQLYQDLQNLIHDLSLVNQISSMISSLKGNYQVPTPSIVARYKNLLYTFKSNFLKVGYFYVIFLSQ